MEPFKNFTGVAVSMPRADINTDAIIPVPWMRSLHVEIGKGLFASERYDDEGRERPDFVLNQEPFRKAQFLIGGENFGCGSSREAAVWALRGFGIRCVLAPSFADIFYENAFRGGVLPARLADDDLASLVTTLNAHRTNPILSIDLNACTVTGPGGRTFSFYVPPSRRDMLLRGDDAIATTLRHDADIALFHAANRKNHPWLYRTVEEAFSKK